jgi:hypothetical protein
MNDFYRSYQGGEPDKVGAYQPIQTSGSLPAPSIPETVNSPTVNIGAVKKLVWRYAHKFFRQTDSLCN